MDGMFNTRPEPQSFAEREFFPALSEIPGEHEYSEDYYEDGNFRKHWCLLAEIQELRFLGRATFTAKDVTGREFVVAFYPEDEDDMPRLLKNMQPGNTIAIMDPLCHYFMDGQVGVRVEESNEALIIPLKLDEAIAMSQEVVKYTAPPGTRRCHGCDEVKQGMSKCGGCGLFFYCGADCQRMAWSNKGHKRACKALKDDNLRWILFLDYADHQGALGFS